MTKIKNKPISIPLNQKQTAPKRMIAPQDKKTKRLTKRVISEAITTIKVLGETIYVNDTSSFLRISHNTGLIECGKQFTVCDNKIQELCVYQIKELRRIHNEDMLGSVFDLNGQYFKADKIAIDLIKKKYPKIEDVYWLFYFSSLLDIATTPLNLERANKIAEYLKLSKNKITKKLFANATSKIKQEQDSYTNLIESKRKSPIGNWDCDDAELSGLMEEMKEAEMSPSVEFCSRILFCYYEKAKVLNGENANIPNVVQSQKSVGALFGTPKKWNKKNAIKEKIPQYDPKTTFDLRNPLNKLKGKTVKLRKSKNK